MNRVIKLKPVDKSKLPKVEIDDLVNNLINVMPESIQVLFRQGLLYFEYDEGENRLFVGGEGVDKKLQENTVAKLDAYLANTPHYFVGLELQLEQ